MNRFMKTLVGVFGIACGTFLPALAGDAPAGAPPPPDGMGRLVIGGFTHDVANCELTFSTQPQFGPGIKQVRGSGNSAILAPGTWYILVTAIEFQNRSGFYVNFMDKEPPKVTLAAGETVTLPAFEGLTAKLNCQKAGPQMLRIDLTLSNAQGAKIGFSLPPNTGKPPAVLIADAEGHAVAKATLQPG